MGTCKKCGATGFFLSVNRSTQLCKKCEKAEEAAKKAAAEEEARKRREAAAEAAREKKRAELDIRCSAQETAKHLHSITTTLTEMADEIVSQYEQGLLPGSSAAAATSIVNKAIARTKEAIAIVRHPDISKVQPTAEAASEAVMALYKEMLELQKKKEPEHDESEG